MRKTFSSLTSVNTANVKIIIRKRVWMKHWNDEIIFQKLKFKYAIWYYHHGLSPHTHTVFCHHTHKFIVWKATKMFWCFVWDFKVFRKNNVHHKMYKTKITNRKIYGLHIMWKHALWFRTTTTTTLHGWTRCMDWNFGMTGGKAYKNIIKSTTLFSVGDSVFI